MIKPNELRIGNKVYFINYDEDAGGNKIGEYDIETVNLPTLLQIEGNPESFDGIPLTPEILEACGFKKDRSGWHLPESKFSLTEQFYPCWMDKMLWPQDIPDFKKFSLDYLHQLMNLYHSLTGEELDVKL